MNNPLQPNFPEQPGKTSSTPFHPLPLPPPIQTGTARFTVSGIDSTSFTPTQPKRKKRRTVEAETLQVIDVAADSPDEPLSTALTRRLPSWLVSTMVHVAILLLLAIVPVAQEYGTPLIISMTDGGSDGTETFELEPPGSFENDTAVAEPSEILVPSEAELSTTSLEAFEDVGATFSQELTSMPKLTAIDSGLSGRSGSMKAALLGAYGGTNATEAAVENGLAWLARNQRADGLWSLRGPYSQGGISENRPSATAMALIAFAGAGYHHKEGKYKTNVDKGIKYLISIQDSEGFFANDISDRQAMYAQGQATIALCELYGMTKDPALRKPAQLAVDFAEAAQSREGGWRYIPREDSDTSVTGWYVMALMSARMAGFSTSKKTLDRVHGFLDTVQYDSGSRYAYMPASGPSLPMTAEGLLCREYLGWEHHLGPLVRGCEFLADNPISRDDDKRDYYYWYYATQTLHHYGGLPWEKWNAVMVEELPRLQIQESKERGSWPPQSDPHGSAGGRLYATCFSIYCLEVYYRHLPLYSIRK